MGGRERDGAAPGERLQDRSRERSALRRVGAAPDLVEQHQRAPLRSGARQDVAQRGDVRREGREARGDGLAGAGGGGHGGGNRGSGEGRGGEGGGFWGGPGP